MAGTKLPGGDQRGVAGAARDIKHGVPIGHSRLVDEFGRRGL